MSDSVEPKDSSKSVSPHQSSEQATHSSAETSSSSQISDEEKDWAAIENLEVTSGKPAKESTASSWQTPGIGGKIVDPFDPLVMVETAFLASTSSLLWLVDYYFPMGPLLRIFFPTPIAITYLRRGRRAAWMAMLVSGLLLTVLMGPTRSILFVMPYGVIGIILGMCWSRGAGWAMSIGLGTIVATFGAFFRIWLVSILLGDDLWLYLTTQVTKLAEWIFLRLGLLIQPSLVVIQGIAFVAVIFSSLMYLFVVHLAAKLLLDRLGTPIPDPPKWVQVLLEE
jgi:uncharacterized protein YybS (DUF2232 family)